MWLPSGDQTGKSLLCGPKVNREAEPRPEYRWPKEDRTVPLGVVMALRVCHSSGIGGKSAQLGDANHQMTDISEQHPPEKRLHEYAAGLLPVHEQGPVEQHILTCRVCQQVIEKFDKQQRQPPQKGRGTM